MSSTTTTPAAKVALILSGSGVYDGTELTEGASSLIHLSRRNADVTMFAPDKPQMHVMNHLTGEEMKDETRNVLVESARLARGNIKPLSDCKASDFDAIVFPGGFGAAKNLSTFATDGDKMKVDKDVERTLKEFVDTNKVIGMCCISPVIAARCIPGVSLTMGSDVEKGKDGEYPHAGAAGAAKSMGAHHENAGYDVAHVDEGRKVVTSAAYMYNGKPHEIDDSVKAMIYKVMDLVEKEKKA